MYFVRHGKTAYNGTGRVSGHTDIPLIAEGIAQAEQVAQEIPDDVSAIYSSDLIRCKQTAEILNKKLGLPITYDERLRERSFGSFDGQVWSDIDPDGTLYKKDHSQKYDYRPQGGESVEDVKTRVLACIRHIRDQEREGPVLVVTSAGVIRLLHHILHNEIHEIVHNSSLHEFDFTDFK